MRGWYAKGSLVIIAVIFGCSYLACKKDGNGTGTTFDFTWVGEQNLNSPITFHSNAPVGSTYLWEFGDSTQSTNSAPQHVYSSGIVYPTDTFTVTLTVNKNSFRSVVKKIVIGPLLDFTFNGLPMVGSTISFQSTALAGSNFLWSFGDGITSTAPTPSHVYSSAGSRHFQEIFIIMMILHS